VIDEPEQRPLNLNREASVSEWLVTGVGSSESEKMLCLRCNKFGVIVRSLLCVGDLEWKP
jgi:hypothetical protein